MRVLDSVVFGRRRELLMSVEQATGFDIQGFGELLNYGDGWIPPPTLDIADIGAVDAGTVSIVLLAPAFLLAKTAYIFAKARANIHAGLMRAVSLIDLQTISDISS